MAEAPNLDAHILQVLPQIYRSSENQQQEWEAVLRQELGRYFDQAEDAVRGYLSARPRILGILTAFERDATAERIVSNYAGREVSRVVELLLDAGGEDARVQGQQQQQQQQLTSIATDTSVTEPTNGTDRMDRRSVTMAPEPPATPSSSRRPPSDTMAPPPRRAAAAPPAPMTLASTPLRARNDHAAPPGPSCLRTGASSAPATPTAAGERTVVAPSRAAGKRPADSTGTPEQQASPSSKRAKKTSLDLARPVPTWKVTRELSLFEVEGDEYVFQDARCGPGWYVVRCNIGTTPFVNAPVRFTRHPLEDPAVLAHFNHKGTCHPDAAYDAASIVEKFGYRVYEDVENSFDPTKEAVEVSNERLKIKIDAMNLPAVRLPGESSPSKTKGKRKASRVASRADADESSGSYRG